MSNRRGGLEFFWTWLLTNNLIQFPWSRWKNSCRLSWELNWASVASFLPHYFFYTSSSILEAAGQFGSSSIQHTSVLTFQLTEQRRKLLKVQETLPAGSLQAKHGLSMPEITLVRISILFLLTSQILLSLMGLSTKVRHFFSSDDTFEKSDCFFLRHFLVIVWELNQKQTEKVT